MKTKLLLIPLVLFALACGDEEPVAPAPVACFTHTPETAIKVGNEITFTNCSENATAYSWDFGNGNTSTDENPTHTYDQEGTYTITQTAIGDGGVNTSIKEITTSFSGSGYFSFNGEIYNLEKGFFRIENPWEDDNTGRFHVLYLSSNTVNINTIDAAPGTGLAVVIAITTDQNNIGNITGDFSIEGKMINNSAASIDDYSWLQVELMEFADNEETDLYIGMLTVDEFTITKTGNTYEINIKGQGEKGFNSGTSEGAIELHFEGIIEN